VWPFKKKPKEVMHLEDLPSKRLIFPDPLLQAEYNEFGTKKKKSVHEHSEIQRKWAEEIEKKRN